MNKLTILFQQVLMISTGILFLVGVNGLVSYLKGTGFQFSWYDPFAIILLGILCSVPTTLFILNDHKLKAHHYTLNLILHCLSIWAIVTIVGRIANWYGTLREFLDITIDYIIVYIFVWVATLWLLRVEDKKINQALKEIRDKE